MRDLISRRFMVQYPKGTKGKMIIEDDQFVCLKGSTAVVDYRPSASGSIKKMREQLITKGILKLQDRW